MIPPKSLVFRHFSAKVRCPGTLAVASTRAGGHLYSAGFGPKGSGPFSHTCYPSPTLRSGPSQAGSHLSEHRRSNADCVTVAKLSFETAGFAVKSEPIKTLTRGSQKCRNQSSSLFFLPHRWQVACRTLRPVALQVRRLAPLSLTGWTKTCWPAQRWAALPVSRPAGLSWACRPARRATDLIPAFGRVHLENHGVARAIRPAGPVLHFCPGLTSAPAGSTRGKPCSRRS
jgi:hypothetical protein